MNTPANPGTPSPDQVRSQAELLDLTDDAVLVWELDGTIEYWNAGAHRLYGFDAGEAVGRVSHDLLATRFPGPAEDVLTALRGAGRWEGELVHTTKAGTRLTVSAVMKTRTRENRVLVLEINRDITQRKQAERELDRMRRLLAEGQRIAHLGSWEYIAPTLTTVWSDEQKRIYGLQPADPSPAYADMLRRFIHPEDAEALDRGFRAAFRDRAQFEHENRVVRPDGTVRHIYNRAQPVFESDGTLGRYVGITMDITERRQAEERLRRSEDRRALALEAAQAGTWEWDPATGTNLWSPEIWGLYGLEPGSCEPSFDAWWQTVHPEDRERSQRILEGLVATKAELSLDWRVQLPAGATRWLTSRGRPLFDDSGRLKCYLGVVMDITARKQAEEEVRQLNASLERRVRERTAELEAANKELEAFSYSVSHDLRAPLRAVNGYVDFLREDYSERLDDEGNRLLGVVRAEAQRMGRLIDDLLAFSRLGRQEVRRTRVDMEQLARTTFEGLLAGVTSATPRLDLRPLPPAQGDPSMLRQVFANLIDNAIKFSSGQPSPSIEVGGAADGAELVYYVRDNGVGFDERYAYKLFGVFQRLHGEEEFPGTGVGLALVQRVLHRHHGRVWAESRPGQGATFHFALPHLNPTPH